MLTKVFAGLTIVASLALAGAAVLGAFSTSTNTNPPAEQKVAPTTSTQDAPASEGCPACKKSTHSCCED